ncbi:Putative ribosomal protein S35 [Septoria linicola]|uniref:Ribosomal protein S35 n=1 Tax=Septoria linicola TaxID=215465 RepID=A0A9Q9AWP1_9PEZI|nr:Putative ribosomal protein S35 [Septoria linicola]
MPPRIQPHRLPSQSTCQCFRTRPTCVPEGASVAIPSQQTRNFHPQPKSKATRQRRNMWEWLNGPGKVFREPLPGSTNYMSAYDKYGNLVRARRGRDNQRGGPPAAQEAEIDVAPAEKEEEIQREERSRGLDEEEITANEQKRNAHREAKAEIEARAGAPKERLSDMRPFPLNQSFRSQSVLSEDLREEIYRQVVGAGVDVSTVSAAFGVDLRRVAAVVRLKSIEKQWEAEDKPLAKAYNEAVLAMLPQTPYKPNNPKQQIFEHESVNDLPVHPTTRQQLFVPVSESRQFTREDAAKAFHDKLLPADKRIPHPELITLEKEHLDGVSRADRWARQQQRDQAAREAKDKAAERKAAWEERTQRIVTTRRWDFKFQDISAEKVGKTGRSREGVGARYGMPHEDRKRGMVKIPTSVE